MPNPYTATEFEAADAFYRVHNNGEQTHVVVLRADADEWVAVAYDIDPTEGTPVAGECIAYATSKQTVLAEARQWMTAHPKGVLEPLDEGEKQSGGVGAMIVRMLKGLNNYGNRLIDQQTQQGK